MNFLISSILAISLLFLTAFAMHKREKNLELEFELKKLKNLELEFELEKLKKEINESIEKMILYDRNHYFDDKNFNGENGFNLYIMTKTGD